MKFFDRWLYRKLRDMWDNKHKYNQYLKEDSMQTQLMAIESDLSWGDGLRININKMIGGYVVSFRCYDRVRDQSDDRHYIITDEQDFEKELGKMITMESMKQQ